ncbi:putative NADPH2 dehydrogenase [Rosellinia necatrix]|uniref:Putative NADPH2 dehydrogenase n=1 Tax=Rosellinia necatrix TaxID=77044 RepID=A0A1W2TBJ3_ROSNE|nr:putative NADPH2 dehydrogenase [Rosellinia necatrix]
MMLNHRVAMAPLTRYRCDDDWVPLPMVKDYYEQRAAVPGTLLITEATFISRAAVCRYNVPGLYSEAQIARWREVTDAVHAKGSYIYCQMWHLGRAGWPEVHAAMGTRLKSSSAVRIEAEDARGVPEEMTEADIWEIIGDFATAARNAMAAGFDGVELHGANGYLIDQFTQDNCNRRTDGWGGSIEKRARFAVEAARAVVAAIGADRVAIRLSPFSDFQSMGMADPYPQFEHLVRRLKPLGLAYLHLVQPRISGATDGDCGAGDSLDSLVRLWGNQSPVVLAGGFRPREAAHTVDEAWPDRDIIVAFGRYFISNPDLVFRLREGIPLTDYDRATFYTPKKAEGYIDFPTSELYRATHDGQAVR